ncbi:MAG: N-acetyltransferase [Asticcacaulis sp.]
MALDALALDFNICLETQALDRQIVELTDRAFGPGRFVKTAERLREDSTPIADLSYVAMQGDRLLGSVRMWPIFIHDFEANTYEPLVFLGPVVVDEAQRGRGIGKALISACVPAAFARGLRAVLLVGSHSFFKPFGFEKSNGIILPGPVDPHRVLIRYSEPDIRFAGVVVKVI